MFPLPRHSENLRPPWRKPANRPHIPACRFRSKYFESPLGISATSCCPVGLSGTGRTVADAYGGSFARPPERSVCAVPLELRGCWHEVRTDCGSAKAMSAWANDRPPRDRFRHLTSQREPAPLFQKSFAAAPRLLAPKATERSRGTSNIGQIQFDLALFRQVRP